jgi:pyrroline-5-carboxylate reductase
MSNSKLAFVGGGNMTRAIASGLLEGGYAADDILISEPFDKQRALLSVALPGVRVCADNDAVVAAAKTVVLAVKPQILAKVCKQLATTVQATRPLILSIAAGIRSVDIDRWLGGKLAVVRVMPNQPALIGAGVSGIFANDATSAAQLKDATRVLSATGAIVTVPDESDIDAVTAISGSGPAYFYLLIDMLIQTGVDLGLNADVARELAIETGKGATLLAGTTGEPIATLIGQISSPGGTTEAALGSLDSSGIRDIFATALTAARDRAVELADQAQATRKD